MIHIRYTTPRCLFHGRFEVIGYGCATCVGNTAPLPEAVVDAIKQVRFSSGFNELLLLLSEQSDLHDLFCSRGIWWPAECYPATGTLRDACATVCVPITWPPLPW